MRGDRRMRPVTMVGVLALGSALTLVPHPVPATAGSPTFAMQTFAMHRLAGADRTATAAAISARFWTSSAPVVFVASAATFPDGLAAGPAATRLGGPVLYVHQGSVPAATSTELVRLQPQRVVAVGGAGVIADAVLDALATTTGAPVTRLSGADRYATAAAVSAAVFSPGVPVAYVATGAAFPDALSGGAAAAARGGPLLLVTPSAVPASTAAELARLRPARIVVVGGTGAVPATVEAALRAYAPAVVRVAGADRYATAVAVSRDTFGPPATAALLATGTNWPDAVTGAAAAGRLGSPVLLVRDPLPAGVAAELQRLTPTTAYALGGTGAVPLAVVREVQHLLGVCWAGRRPTGTATSVVGSVPAASGQVALTFDMGGRLEPGPDIVDLLVANQVCATIFPTGAMSQTAEGRAVLAKVAEHPELFEVGNHSMHHCDLVKGGGGSPSALPCLPVVPPSQAFVQTELTTADAIIAEATGLDPRPYWRPPYGSHTSTVRGWVAAVGYPTTVTWSVDTIDWRPESEEGPTAQEIADTVLTEAADGDIVLMHLGGWNTLPALQLIIPAERARGTVLTTVSDLRDGA